VTATQKNNKKTLLIASIVIIIIVVAGIAAFVLSQNSNDPSDSTTPTATPTETASPSSADSSPDATNTPTTSSTDVAGASSLKYTVSLTENGVLQGTYTFQGKNAGTDNFMMRIDYTDNDGATTFIFNGAQHKAWTFSGDEWVDISDYYDLQFQTWDSLWQGYSTNLAAWTGLGDYSYSSDGNTVRIYDIAVNPTLDDSLFVHL
jgi:hypothetical protein